MSHSRGASEHFVENRPQRIQEQFRLNERSYFDMLNPVINTYYRLSDMPVSDVYLYYVKGRFQTIGNFWRFRVTVDGVPYIGGPALNHNEWQYVSRNISGDIIDATLEGWREAAVDPVSFMVNEGLYCQTLDIEIECTAVAAGDTLRGRALYGSL